MNLPLRRSVAALVSASLLLVSPGLAPYAAAQTMTRAVSAGGTTGAVVPVLGTGANAELSAPLSPSALTLTPSLGAASVPTIGAVEGVKAAPTAMTLSPVAAQTGASAVIAAAKSPVAAATIVAPTAARPVALSKTVAAASKRASDAVEAVGDVSKASASEASGLGKTLELVLTGGSALSRGGDVVRAASLEMAEGNGSFLAKPAGKSISEAANEDNGNVPMPPSDGAPKGPRDNGPFWPRLLSAGLALTPAVVLGWPLLAASAYLVGGLVVATSVSLAIMPFLSDSSSKALRGAPGVLLMGLGAAVFGVSLSLSIGLGVAVAPILLWTGALALLGGWGLARYGLGKTERRWGSYASVETLSAFFGGLAATTAVALAASTPLGAVATVVLWVSVPLSALLWFHLPGWVGAGLESLLVGFWHAGFGLSRVLTAAHRDTLLYDRLSKFSERYWESSKWNGVWLALLWTPLVLGEAAMYVTSALGGLFVGAVAAPLNFLWGASQKLWPKSKANVYFAEASRLQFDNVQNGKVKLFNTLEARIVPFANSPKLLQRIPAAVVLRIAQLGWLAYSVVASPFLALGGLVAGFVRLGSYDEKRHDVDSLKVDRRDGFEKPSEPVEPAPVPSGKTPLLPKLIAVAIALAPAVFFGLPILAGHSLIQMGLYFPLALSLAAMPFLAKAPYWAKVFAGKALYYNGLALTLFGASFLAGPLALLAGWGFQRWVKKTQEEGGESFDEAELGAFFAALSASAAVGAVWAGYTLASPFAWAPLLVAALTSPFLLMHLPRWFGEGVLGLFRAFPESIKAWGKVLGFWHLDTKFESNLRDHASYWLKRTYWNGVWLSVIWVPTGVVMLAEYLLAVALGLVTGLFRAPFQALEDARAKARPGSRLALFAAGLNKGWIGAAEGGKGGFDALVSRLKPAMDEAAPVTGRPTLKAAGAFLVARVLQVLWLVGAFLMNATGVAFLIGVAKGLKAAFAPAKP